MFVSPDELRAASKGVRDLGGSLPPTGADAAANALAGSATTAALGQTEVARRQAESVIRGRFKQIGYYSTNPRTSTAELTRMPLAG